MNKEIMEDRIEEIIKESIRVKEKISRDQISKIAEAVKLISDAIKGGGKVILFGNGGSAADAQHISGELVGRFKIERSALPAIALTTNPSTLTAISNDYGYEMTFTRQVEGLGRRGDVVVGISTSGNSLNVVEAIKRANKMEMKTIALTGNDGGKVSEIADLSIIVPSDLTPRIQESHILIGHIICELVEEELFSV